MLSGAVMYSTTVIFSGKLRAIVHDLHFRVSSVKEKTAHFARQASRRLSVASWDRGNDPLLEGINEDLGFSKQVSDEVEEFFKEHRDSGVQEKWHAARKAKNPVLGSVMHVRVELRNRLMDR